MTFCEVWQHNYLQYCNLLDFGCIPFSVSFLNTLDLRISSPRGTSIYIYLRRLFMSVRVRSPQGHLGTVEMPLMSGDAAQLLYCILRT